MPAPKPSQRADAVGSTAISRVGELMNRLQELAIQSPARFAALATQTSSDLQSAAAAQGDDGTAGKLTELSARFAEVARTGDAAALLRSPPGAPGPPSPSGTAELSAQIDAAFNLKPPPLGPWFPK